MNALTTLPVTNSASSGSRTRAATPRSAQRLALALAPLLLVGACQSANRGDSGADSLRIAQEAFDSATARETPTDFLVPGVPAKRGPADLSAAIAPAAGARVGYTRALEVLGAIDAKEQARLESQQLWGVALTLEALAHWRLGDTDAALVAAESAEQQDLRPRDKAVAQTLVPLIRTSQLYAKIAAAKPEVARLRAGVAGASTGLERHEFEEPLLERQKEFEADLASLQALVAEPWAARHTVPADDPVQLWLIQSQLAAFRNYDVAYTLAASAGVVQDAGEDGLSRERADDAGPMGGDYVVPAVAEASYTLAELKGFLTTSSADEQERLRVFETWRDLLGIVNMVRP